MKRILQIILILCLIFLAGCGGAGQNAGAGAKQATSGGGAAAEETDASEASGQAGTASGETGTVAETPAGTDISAEEPAGTGAPSPEQGTAGNDGGDGSGDGSAASGGKPAPVEPQDVKVDKKTELRCGLLITCRTISDNMDRFDQAKLEVRPEDGVIYETKETVFYEGESVFDVLLRETRENKIHMEFVETPGYSSNYIEGIGNIYEFDCGELSGWMYKVNDWFPNYGSSRYLLKDGDKIEWIYTCDLGRDIGGDWAAQNRTEEQ